MRDATPAADQSRQYEPPEIMRLHYCTSCRRITVATLTQCCGQPTLTATYANVDPKP